MKKLHRNPLKPCPYCGGAAYFADFGHPGIRRTYIDAQHKRKCKIRPNTYSMYESVKKRIKAWNRRAYESNISN